MPNLLNLAWNIEVLRVTAFQDGSFNPKSLENWLETISENTPVHVNKTATSFLGISRSQDGFIRVEWNKDRFDARLSSEEPENDSSVASFSDIERLFNKLVDSVPEIQDLPSIDRIALGVVLTMAVENESEGLTLLAPAIRDLSIGSTAHDFLYRVNYPLECPTLGGIKINRLTTWSVGQVQLVRVHIQNDGSQIEEIVNKRPTAIRLELDINTAQSLKLGADRENLIKILNELKAIAINIASNGELAMLN